MSETMVVQIPPLTLPEWQSIHDALYVAGCLMQTSKRGAPGMLYTDSLPSTFADAYEKVRYAERLVSYCEGCGICASADDPTAECMADLVDTDRLPCGCLSLNGQGHLPYNGLPCALTSL